MEQVTIKLFAILANGEKAKTHQADQVVAFVDEKRQVRIGMGLSVDRYLETKKATYRLVKHETLNLYQGDCNGCKVHFTHKKIVGKLIYWQ